MKISTPFFCAALGLVTWSCDSVDGLEAGSGGQSSTGGVDGAGGGELTDTGGRSNASGGETADATGGETSAGGNPTGSGGDGSGGSGTGGVAGDGVVKSAGCGKANPPTGSVGSPLTVSGHQYYVKLPASYDPDTAYPVLMVFHPTGNPIDWAEKSAGYEATSAKDEAIRVYPHSSGSGWEATDVTFFAPFHEQILSDFCVDETRVFAAGESSGGDFAGVIGCEHADKLRAIAPCATKPVSGYPLDAGSRNCTGQVASIVIHGKNDNVVGTANAEPLKNFYREVNHCDETGDPVEGYTDTLSNCVKYQGCDEGFPVYFCYHTDPEYSGTNHGWPKFAGKMTWATFSEY